MKPDDRALDHDLAALAAGMLPGIVLAAADLGHGLQLVVALERHGLGRTLWRIVIHGNPALASDVRLTDTRFHVLQFGLDRALAAGAARGWRLTKRTDLLADLGEVAVGLGVAAGEPWAVVMFHGGATLRLPAGDLGRLRDALAAAAGRIGRAGVVPQPASGSVQ